MDQKLRNKVIELKKHFKINNNLRNEEYSRKKIKAINSIVPEENLVELKKIFLSEETKKDLKESDRY